MGRARALCSSRHRALGCVGCRTCVRVRRCVRAGCCVYVKRALLVSIRPFVLSLPRTRQQPFHSKIVRPVRPSLSPSLPGLFSRPPRRAKRYASNPLSAIPLPPQTQRAERVDRDRTARSSLSPSAARAAPPIAAHTPRRRVRLDLQAYSSRARRLLVRRSSAKGGGGKWGREESSSSSSRANPPRAPQPPLPRPPPARITSRRSPRGSLRRRRASA